MTTIRGDTETRHEIDISRLISDARQQAGADPRVLRFKIARKPGIAWINALKRERRRRRSTTAGGQIQVDVSLRALLRLDDAEFIRKAYIKLLGRRPDPSGIASNLALLDGRRSSKIRVLEILSRSPEGRARNVHVPGLALAIAWNRVFGYDVLLSELLRYDGPDFVNRVYARVLMRAPDPSGYAYYLDEAARGRAGKINVLASAVRGREGREKRSRVRGLMFALVRQRLYARLADVGARALTSIVGRRFTPTSGLQSPSPDRGPARGVGEAATVYVDVGPVRGAEGTERSDA